MTDPAITLSVWRALGEHDRPVATGGGPRISERLAARLGLAYLGFGMPEVVVTRKHHSPVVRLMRRSEFQAMQGSSSALDSDPLVWVVEAQGSWRTAGIVPEEKRQDFSVGLVAFDADTGRRYGGSHGNTSLLGTPGGSQPSTPPPPKPTPSPPPNIPEPRSSQDTVTSEEREEVKARRGPPPWGPHTAGSVIQIAGQHLQLPADVYVEAIISKGLCIAGEPCPVAPLYVLRRGDSLASIEKRTGRFAPGTPVSTMETFDFIEKALR